MDELRQQLFLLRIQVAFDAPFGSRVQNSVSVLCDNVGCLDDSAAQPSNSLPPHRRGVARVILAANSARKTCIETVRRGRTGRGMSAWSAGDGHQKGAERLCPLSFGTHPA